MHYICNSARPVMFKTLVAHGIQTTQRQVCAIPVPSFRASPASFSAAFFFLSDNELEEQPELESSSTSLTETASPAFSTAGKSSGLQAC